MARTFDSSKVTPASTHITPPIHLTPPQIEGELPLREHEGKFRSMHELTSEEVDEEVLANRESNEYETIFGKMGRGVGPGRFFRKRRILSGIFSKKPLEGLEEKLWKYKAGRKGNYLTSSKIKQFVELAQEAVKDVSPYQFRHSEHRRLPPFALEKLKSRLYQLEREGKLSQFEVEDFINIMKHLEL